MRAPSRGGPSPLLPTHSQLAFKRKNRRGALVTRLILITVVTATVAYGGFAWLYLGKSPAHPVGHDAAVGGGDAGGIVAAGANGTSGQQRARGLKQEEAKAVGHGRTQQPHVMRSTPGARAQQQWQRWSPDAALHVHGAQYNQPPQHQQQQEAAHRHSTALLEASGDLHQVLRHGVSGQAEDSKNQQDAADILHQAGLKQQDQLHQAAKAKAPETQPGGGAQGGQHGSAVVRKQVDADLQHQQHQQQVEEAKGHEQEAHQQDSTERQAEVPIEVEQVHHARHPQHQGAGSEGQQHQGQEQAVLRRDGSEMRAPGEEAARGQQHVAQQQPEQEQQREAVEVEQVHHVYQNRSGTDGEAQAQPQQGKGRRHQQRNEEQLEAAGGRGETDEENDEYLTKPQEEQQPQQKHHARKGGADPGGGRGDALTTQSPAPGKDDVASSGGDEGSAVHLPPSLFQLSAKTIDGEEQHLSVYKGNVTLVVNVASACGYTDLNYKGLTKLYQKYHSHGLEILAFPCNQFGMQEPHAEAQIKEFCSSTYHVTFPMFSKVEVNGVHAHPVFKFLKSQTPVDQGGGGGQGPGEDLAWNFFKFLVDHTGRPVRRFNHLWDQVEMEQAVYELLMEQKVVKT